MSGSAPGRPARITSAHTAALAARAAHAVEVARLTAELAEARKPRWVDFCGTYLLVCNNYAVAEVKHGDPGTVYWSANLAKPWARVATEAEAKDAAERAAGV